MLEAFGIDDATKTEAEFYRRAASAIEQVLGRDDAAPFYVAAAWREDPEAQRWVTEHLGHPVETLAESPEQYRRPLLLVFARQPVEKRVGIVWPPKAVQSGAEEQGSLVKDDADLYGWMNQASVQHYDSVEAAQVAHPEMSDLEFGPLPSGDLAVVVAPGTIRLFDAIDNNAARQQALDRLVILGRQSPGFHDLNLERLPDSVDGLLQEQALKIFLVAQLPGVQRGDNYLRAEILQRQAHERGVEIPLLNVLTINSFEALVQRAVNESLPPERRVGDVQEIRFYRGHTFIFA